MAQFETTIQIIDQEIEYLQGLDGNHENTITEHTRAIAILSNYHDHVSIIDRHQRGIARAIGTFQKPKA